MPNEIYHKSHWGNANAEGFGDVYFDAAATNKLYNHSDYYENSNGTDKILRDLSNKASIVLTPTAYSDGSLNTVIPPYQVLPTELVTNGDFDTDSDWTKGVGWTISDGAANFNTTSNSSILQNLSITSGKKYRIQITGEITSGALKLTNGSGLGNDAAFTLPLDVTYTHDGGANTIEIRTIGASVGYLDNVSVKEIQEADFDFSRGSSATRVNEKGLIESIASGLPRIDYTSGFGSLLLEPQRTNLVPYSNDFNQHSITGGSITSDDIVSPDGSVNADTFVEDTNSSYHFIREDISVSSGTYTMSVFVKGTSRFFSLYPQSAGVAYALFDIASETITKTGGANYVNSDIQNYGNGWYRCILTYTVSTGTSFLHIYLSNSSTTQAAIYTGNGSEMSFYGLQLEAGSYATSYIVSNSGSTTTRSADAANNSGNADLFNDSEGVLYAEIAALANDGTTRRFSISDGSYSNRITLELDETSNTLKAFIISANTTYYSPSEVLSNITNYNKTAIKYKQNDFSLWINGFEFDVDNSGNTPINLSQMQFADGNGSDAPLYGNVKELAVFKEALTDAELESLTSWVSFTEMATDLEYTLE